MAHPIHGGIGTVLSFIDDITRERKRPDGLPRLQILPHFDDFREGSKRLLEDILGTEHQLNEGEVEWVYRGERLRRLREGEFKVKTPKQGEEVLGEKVEIPENTVIFEHKRAHHPCAEFDPKKFESEDLFEIKFSEEQPGTIEKIVNVDLVSDYGLSTASVLRTRLTLPGSVRDVLVRYAHFRKEELVPFIELLKEMEAQEAAKGKSKRDALRVIADEQIAFVREHEELYRAVMRGTFVAAKLVGNAQRKLLDEYSRRERGLPHIGLGPSTYVGIESNGFVLWSHGLGPKLPLTVRTLEEAYVRVIEAMPYNAKFHDELARALVHTSKQKRYEERSWEKLRVACYHLRRRSYDAAISSAAAAFEVQLDGFLKENGISKSEIDTASLREKTQRLFDRAVRKTGYKQRSSRLFHSGIYRRLLDSRAVGRSVHDLRSEIVHGSAEENRGSSEAALVAISYYAEAIDFIQSRGWRGNGDYISAGDFIAWASPELDGAVPRINADIGLAAGETLLRRTRQYLQPEEIEIMKRRTPQESWSYRIFTEE